jgi:hypothetical protein
LLQIRRYALKKGFDIAAALLIKRRLQLSRFLLGHAAKSQCVSVFKRDNQDIPEIALLYRYVRVDGQIGNAVLGQFPARQDNAIVS